MHKLVKLIVQMMMIALILISFSLAASAQYPCYTLWNCYGGDGYYSNYSQESIPYFALHPPVYYSYPVARTYGLYPFPYVAESVAVNSTSVEPKLVINPYVEQSNKPEKVVRRIQPLRIVNHYVEQAGTEVSEEKADWEKENPLKPKVIYPANLAFAK
jgi:hypothetical protein